MRGQRALAVGLVALMGVPLGSCSRDEGGYQLTAYFERAVGLYESGDVEVLGLPVGTIDEIAIEGERVRVEMTIRDDVPLPADVQATIGQTQLIGERNVVLFPSWSEELEASGAEQAGDGDVIPVERTVTPVEPDEGLAAFEELARSIEGDVLADLVGGSREVLEGRGEQLGQAIDEAAGLTTTLASVDEKLVEAAEDLHVLAGTLRSRDEQLGRLVDTFSSAAEVLAQEREGIETFLQAILGLTEQGTSILDLYGEQLPQDIASATALMSIFEENLDSIDALIATLPELADGVARAYQPTIDGLFLRSNLTTTLTAVLGLLGEELLETPREIVDGLQQELAP